MPATKVGAEDDCASVTGYELSDVDASFPTEATGIVTYHVKQDVAPRGKPGGAMTQEMHDTSTWCRPMANGSA